MTSRQFFGNNKGCKDISISLLNEQDEVIYEMSYTTFYGSPTPNLMSEVNDAVNYYHKEWKYKGEPVKATVFTTPTYNSCEIDLITNKKVFS